MALIGMLYKRSNPQDVRKAYACAAVAKMEDEQFFYFTLGNVNIEYHTIKGWIFESGQWIQKEMPFPDVIYNACGPRNDKQRQVYRYLKKIIPFTSHSVRTKMVVYKKLEKGEEYAQFLIPFQKVKEFSTVTDFLNQHGKIVFKPVTGNKGRNVFFIEKQEDQFWVQEGLSKTYLGEEDFKVLIEGNIKDRKFLVQKYIECKTKTGLTYDFRMHVQKNGNGEWVITRIYPRLSSGNKGVNNISSGGFRGELLYFLMDEFGEEHYNMTKYLEKFALLFPKHFDSLYEHDFDELGIDVALDEDGKIWIFEVNWRPGCKNRELDFASNLIPYAAYLARKEKNNKNKLGR